jgi:hypothetical protein
MGQDHEDESEGVGTPCPVLKCEQAPAVCEEQSAFAGAYAGDLNDPYKRNRTVAPCRKAFLYEGSNLRERSWGDRQGLLRSYGT